MKDDHAIVVGINEYPELTSLKGPCTDAKRFAEWLADPDGGNVPKGNIRVLMTTDFHPPGPSDVNDVHPVEDEINQLFRPIVKNGVENGHVGRRLYIYMAGHGFADPLNMDTAALYAANAEFSFVPHIAGTSYANWFGRNGIFDEIILVMDCCRTTMPMQSIRPPPLHDTSNASQAARVKTFYAYGTSWGATARERQMKGSVRGIFTTALLQAMRNARPNNRGNVTGQIIKNHIHNIIAEVADGTEIAPPEIQLDSNRDIAFLVRESAHKIGVIVTLTPHQGDEVLVVTDGGGKEISKVTCATNQVDLELGSGLYKAAIQGTNRSNLFEVVGSDVQFTL